jgi:DNA-directed RNA polymerase II subunit RPB1
VNAVEHANTTLLHVQVKKIVLTFNPLGHFGHIEFPLPLFHPGFMEDIVDILKCVCFFCSRVLLDRKDPKYKRVSQIPNRATRIKQLKKLCKG